MSYVYIILLVIVLVAVYMILYILNSKTKKPDNCKSIECDGCKLECEKRRDS